MRSIQSLTSLALFFSYAAISYAQEQSTELKHDRPPTPEERAQSAGLKWLAAQQQADGGWESERVIDPKTQKDQVRLGRNGATALALITLYQSGHTIHDRTEYRSVCQKGLDFLLKNAKQAGEGKYSWIDAEGGQLSHALAVLFICDAYGITKDKALLEFAQGGLNFTFSTTDEKHPGWGIMPGDVPNLEVTVWQTVALRAGAMAYLSIDPQTLKNLVAALNKMVPTDAVLDKLHPADLSQAIIARIHFGWKYDNQVIQNTGPILSKYKPDIREPATNYYVGRVLYKLEEDTRKAWLEIMPPVILAAQVKSDHIPGQLPPLLLPGQKHSDELAGSWPPGKPSISIRLGQNRFEATCLNLLTLGYATAPGRKHDWVLKRDFAPVDESFPL